MGKDNSLQNFEKRKKIQKGVDTIFRVVSKNHQALSDNADRKANILLSVNAIIISITLSNLFPKLDNPTNHYLIYPTLIFLCFGVISIFISIAVTKPHINSHLYSKGGASNQNANMLFFGNFHKMTLEDFETEIEGIMRDKDYLYISLTKDLYFLGKVLWHKYAILKTAYTFFLIGIIITIISFIIAFYYVK
tara:strand:- start:16931 stop:17506 length:576 start_codon:yes stop_codon:yes gene_type:complete